MFNNPLIHEETKLKISERELEAKGYQLNSQLGYRDQGLARWVFVIMVLVIALILTMALL
jgi:hypothetical protein